jgi:hypothetical protein
VQYLEELACRMMKTAGSAIDTMKKMHHARRYIDPILIDMAQPDRKGAMRWSERRAQFTQLPVPAESCVYKSQLNAQTDGHALHGEIAADYTDMIYAATHVEVEGCRKASIATTSIKPPFGTPSAQRTWAAG